MPNYEVVSRKPAFSLTRYLTVFFLKARQFKLSAALAAVASFAVLLIFFIDTDRAVNSTANYCTGLRKFFTQGHRTADNAFAGSSKT